MNHTETLTQTAPWIVPSGSHWSRPAPNGQAPCARCGHTTTKAGTRLFLFGGWSGTKMYNDLYILEPETMRWIKPTPTGKPPRIRAGHTCTAIGPAFPPLHSLLSEKALNITSGMSPTSNTPTKFSDYSPRSNYQDQDSTTIHSASANASHLTYEDPNAPTTEPSMKEPNLTATSLSTPAPSASQRLLIFGGGDSEILMNDLHVLEVDSLAWSPVFSAGISPSPRSRHTATLVRTTLWVIGGLGDSQSVYNDVHNLNTSSMVWSKPVLRGTPMTPRWGHSAIRNGGLIIIFGGHDGVRALNDLHILDTDAMMWKTVEMNCYSPSNPFSALNSSNPLVQSHNQLTSSACLAIQSIDSAIHSQSNTPIASPRIIVAGQTEATPQAESNSNGNHTDAKTSPITMRNNITTNQSNQEASKSISNSQNSPLHQRQSSGSESPQLQSSDHHANIGPFLPAPRCGHTANFVLLGRERKMVIFGGCDHENLVYNDTCVLDLENWVWVKPVIKGTAPLERSVHTTNMIDDKLFVIGDSSASSSRRPRRPVKQNSRPSILASQQQQQITQTSPTANNETGISSNIRDSGGGHPVNANSAVNFDPKSNATPLVTIGENSTNLNGGNHTIGENSDSDGESTNSSLSTTANSSATSSMSMLPSHFTLTSGEFSLSCNNSPGNNNNSNYISLTSLHPVPNNHPIEFSQPQLLSAASVAPIPPVKRRSSSTMLTDTHNQSPASSTGSNPSPRSRRISLSSGTLAPLPAIATLYNQQQHQQQPNSPISKQLNPQYLPPQNSGSLDPALLTFLHSLGLQKYAPKFEAEEIDMTVLPYLTDTHLQMLGITTLGARLRIMNAVNNLKSPSNNSNLNTVKTIPQMTLSNAHLSSSGGATPLPVVPNGNLSNGTAGANAPIQVEVLEQSMERLVSTILVAVDSLSYTMNTITARLTDPSGPLAMAANASTSTNKVSSPLIRPAPLVYVSDSDQPLPPVTNANGNSGGIHPPEHGSKHSPRTK